MKTIAVWAISIIFILGIGLVLFKGGSDQSKQDSVNNVSIVDGKQIIEIDAKGGYSPKLSIAKAGVPTILRVKTNGSFDCSTAIRIPSLNKGTNLPQTGTTDIDLGSPSVGLLRGTCAMGMYNFEISFN